MKTSIRLIQRLKLALRWKLLTGYLVPNLLLLVALGFALVTLFDIPRNLKSSYERTELINQIEITQEQQVASVLDFAWSGISTRLNEYAVTSKNLLSYIDSFKPSELQQANYQTLKDQASSFQTTLTRIIELVQGDREVEALELWRTSGLRQSNQVIAVTRELNAQELRSSEISYETTLQNANNTAGLITALSILALVLAIGSALLITTAVISSINQLQKRLFDLASGDLTQTVQIVNRDELGDLGGTYNNTLYALRGLVRQLLEQSQHLNESICALNMQARNQVTGSSQQANASVEITQTLGQLTKAAEDIATQTLRVSTSVEESLTQARLVSELATNIVDAHDRGRDILEHTIGAVYTLKDQFEAIEQQQQAIMSQTSVISSVRKLLENTAQETHLLALNALIEAAGAGSYGNRFAVIANQIKQLAAQVVNGNREIGTSLVGVLEMLEYSSQISRQGLLKAVQAVEEVGSADQVLLDLAELSHKIKKSSQFIVSYIEGTAELAATIQAATQQQRIASGQIFQTMQAIKTVTVQNLDSIKLSEDTTQQLSYSVQQLKLVASGFKLDTIPQSV